MARGNDPGKDFDDQYNASRRRGQGKAARGESHWAQDKYLEGLRSQPGGRSEPPRGCSDKTAALLVAIGGVAWGLTEVVSRVT